MKQFNVFVEDKIGELARVTEALAQSAINIRGLATDKLGPRHAVRIITDDEISTRKALSRAGLQFDEADVLVVDLIDKPGEIARFARKAAKAGVNINSVFLLGRKGTPAALALVVSDAKKAEAFLKDNQK
jgi:hypothetical protein